MIPTYLEDINALPRDETVDLILVVEMSSEHLGRLIHGVFNLHSDTTTSLRLLDKLRADDKKTETKRILWAPNSRLGSCD